jgi:hypothetical protein
MPRGSFIPIALACVLSFGAYTPAVGWLCVWNTNWKAPKSRQYFAPVRLSSL